MIKRSSMEKSIENLIGDQKRLIHHAEIMEAAHGVNQIVYISFGIKMLMKNGMRKNKMNVYILFADYKNFSYRFFDIVGVYTDKERLAEDKASLELSNKEHDIIYYVKTAPFIDGKES